MMASMTKQDAKAHGVKVFDKDDLKILLALLEKAETYQMKKIITGDAER